MILCKTPFNSKAWIIVLNSIPLSVWMHLRVHLRVVGNCFSIIPLHREISLKFCLFNKEKPCEPISLKKVDMYYKRHNLY